MRLRMGYPDLKSEVLVIMGECAGVTPDELPAVVDIPTLQAAIAQVRKNLVDPGICEYAARLAAKTREHEKLRYGASPRGSIALIRAAQALAATHGRAFVTVDDVKGVAHAVLEHRLILTPDAELNQLRPADIVKEILEKVPVPTSSVSGA
jgi:MoxR-like ATPase